MLAKILFFAFLWTVESTRILGIFPTPDINHFTLGYRVMDALAKKGHQVTMVSPFAPEEFTENLTSIRIGQEIVLETVNKLTTNFNDKIDLNFISNTISIYKTAHESTEALLSDPNFQYLLQSHQIYDVIVAEYFMNEALLGVSSYFFAPLVLLSPYPSSSLMNDLFANPAPSAYIPNILSGHTGSMGFGERFHNFLCNNFNKHYKYYIALPKQEKLLKKYINVDYSLVDSIDDVSLVLLNSHPSVTEPVPHTPNMIEVGGLHITSPKLLPHDLQHFVQKASGVVYFALDPDLTASNLGKEKVADILKGFSQFDDLSFVWNLNVDEDIGEVPKNVMIVEDVPHQDIFGEKNVVAFITDGNLLRIFEAIYFKKPIIGIPLVNDQKTNIAKVAEDGYGIKLPFKELSGDKLHQAIKEILKNGDYSYNIYKKSKLLKDQLVSPLDTAVYWIEYVMRHGRTRHLQSPGVHLPMFKRHLIDIVIVLTIIDLILFLIFYYIFKHIIHLGLKKYKERKTRKYVQLEKDFGK